MDPWRWQPHPEVWVLVVAIVLFGVYAVRVIGPKAAKRPSSRASASEPDGDGVRGRSPRASEAVKRPSSRASASEPDGDGVRGRSPRASEAVPAGSPVVSRRQVGWFVLAVLGLWFSADWPLHDIGETYLYSAHMLQHTLVSVVVAPLFLLATPTWLARLIVGDGWFGGRGLRLLARPVAAAVIYNAVIVFLHWPALVDFSVGHAGAHFGLHLLLFVAALLVWLPVCGPIPELRLSLPAQMIYLFLMSVVPTIPAAWLTFAEGVVYKSYDIPYRMFGLSARSDQQLAGLFMKLAVGGYLWLLIIVQFFRWASRHEEADRRGRVVTEREVLTWDEVRAELDSLDRLGPAPQEPSAPG